MTGLRKGSILYNFDRARHMPYIVLVEGVTDVWRLGDVGVAAFGKDISAEQISLLMEASGGQKPVVVLLDGGEDRAAWQALSRLRQQGSPVVSVDLPEGLDPADYHRQRLLDLIHEQAQAQGVTLSETEAVR